MREENVFASARGLPAVIARSFAKALLEDGVERMNLLRELGLKVLVVLHENHVLVDLF